MHVPEIAALLVRDRVGDRGDRPLSSLSPDPVSENVIAVPSLELFQFGPRDAS